MYIRPVGTPAASRILTERPGMTGVRSTDKAPFSDVLKAAADTLGTIDQDMSDAQMDLALGNARDFHTAVLATEKASLALDLAISLRNKAIEAYQEMMRMPV